MIEVVYNIAIASMLLPLVVFMGIVVLEVVVGIYLLLDSIIVAIVGGTKSD